MELRGRYKTLIDQVAKRQPETVLEIGTHMGNSAIAMVNKARTLSKFPELYWKVSKKMVMAKHLI